MITLPLGFHRIMNADSSGSRIRFQRDREHFSTLGGNRDDDAVLASPMMKTPTGIATKKSGGLG
jgi:hypothetical protein